MIPAILFLGICGIFLRQSVLRHLTTSTQPTTAVLREDSETKAKRIILDRLQVMIKDPLSDPHNYCLVFTRQGELVYFLNHLGEDWDVNAIILFDDAMGVIRENHLGAGLAKMQDERDLALVKVVKEYFHRHPGKRLPRCIENSRSPLRAMNGIAQREFWHWYHDGKHQILSRELFIKVARTEGKHNGPHLWELNLREYRHLHRGELKIYHHLRRHNRRR